jgi:hypothetical protein
MADEAQEGQVEYSTDWFPNDAALLVSVMTEELANEWDRLTESIGVQGRAEFSDDYSTFRIQYRWFGPQEFNEETLVNLITTINNHWKAARENV